MPKPHAILIVGAGHLQCHAIRTARPLGLLPLVTDRDPQAPGIVLAERWYNVSTYDAAAHQGLVPVIQQEYTLRGVITAGADVAPTVAAVAEEAGLPGIPYFIAMRTHDKSSTRGYLQRNKAASQYTVDWGRYGLPDANKEIAASIISELGFPLVIKPVSQSASRGISIAHNADELSQAICKAQKYGTEILAERCLTGTEHSAEMLLHNGSVIWFNIVDRVFSYDNGVPLELGHINPSKLTSLQWSSVYSMMRQAAAALGVTWGPFKCDVMWTEDGPKILECAARLSGGYDSQGTSLALGCDPTRALIQMACNMWVDAPLAQRNGKYAACAAAFPAPGVIVTAPDTRYDHSRPWNDDVRQNVYRMPGVQAVHLHKHVGQRIEPYQDCAARPAFVIATAESYDMAWERSRAAVGVLADGYVMEGA